MIAIQREAQHLRVLVLHLVVHLHRVVVNMNSKKLSFKHILMTMTSIVIFTTTQQIKTIGISSYLGIKKDKNV